MVKSIGRKFSHVSVSEGLVMKKLHDKGWSIGAIASTMKRSKDTVAQHTNKKVINKKIGSGRPLDDVRTPQGFARMQKAYAQLLRASGGKHEVGPIQIKAAMGLTCSVKTIKPSLWGQ